jgi:ATP-dependent DNA helicase RecG
MTTLSTPISDLPKVGKSITKNLQKLGIETVSNLLFYFPYKHLDFSVFSKIKDIHVGETVTIKVKVNSIANRFSFKNKTSLCEAVVSDDSGSLKVIWFNQPYIKDYLKIGDEVLLSGKTSFYKQLQLNNPIYEKSSEDTIHTGRIVPIYSVTENLYNKTLRRIIKPCLKLAVGLTDIVPQEISNKYSLFKQAQAIEEIHFPSSQNNLEKAKLKITFNKITIFKF